MPLCASAKDDHMALMRRCAVPCPRQRETRRRKHWNPLIFLSASFLSALLPPLCRAQLQQPIIFSSAGAVAVRNDQTGALTAVQGSPFAPSTSNALTIDVQGRYLFSVGTDSIHMFQITDATTGAYSEVCGSPFASPTTKSPLFIAVEPTGQFIAVVDDEGNNPGDASVETFAIVPSAPVLCPGASTGPALIPVLGSATELDSTPVGTAQPPDNKNFLIFMGPNPLSSNPTMQKGSEFQALSIDPATGYLAGLQSGNADPDNGLSFAMDPQGRYYATGTRDNLLETGSIQINGLNGTITAGNVSLPSGNAPMALWIDSTGSFLYAVVTAPSTPTAVQIYSVNLQTSALSLLPTSPLPNSASLPGYFADPTGSFDYGFGSDENTIIAYTVDPLTGYFVETGNSPFTIAQIGGSLTFSIPPGGQGVSGPSVELSATSLSFGSQQTGTSGAAQVITLTSNGGQALSVDSIALSGADPTQFTESDTCQTPAVLQPTKFCSISIVFAPTNTGSQQANLVIMDNAPGSPQMVQLSGSGQAPPPPEPAVTINPNPLTFATITQGTTSSPMTITVTNSGNATLHITSVTLGGNNPGDFNMNNACSGAYAANNSCTISMTFTPLAAGQRSATITIADDAQNSPQVVQVNGTANPGQPTTPLVTLSAQSVGFGSVTQGTSGAAQNITVSNSGGAALHISSVALGGTSPADYILANGCTASPYAVNATCTLGVTFAPLSTGTRAATITITDDAPNSPQTITLTGTANAAVSIGVAPGGSTAASVSAGQTGQYNLQITPGAGFSGTASLACSGAPQAATCQIPASVQVTNGSPAVFTVSVSTTGSNAAIPSFERLGISRRPFTPFFLTLAGALLFALLPQFARFTERKFAPRVALVFASAVFLTVAGCGGGSAVQQVTPPPPQLVTPAGSYALTITPTANSASGKALQLPAIQLTLTVN
jgi:hypothetical protein